MSFYVVGTSGSGKSTLARLLAERFDVTHIELDHLSFGPNWEVRPVNDFVQDVKSEMAKGPWVICGNYKEILALALQDADHVVWLDYSFSRILWQTFKRTMGRLIRKEKCCGGNQETWRQQFFTEKSIFVWVFRTYKKNKRRFQNVARYSLYGDRLVRLKSPRDLGNFLKTL